VNGLGIDDLDLRRQLYSISSENIYDGVEEIELPENTQPVGTMLAVAEYALKRKLTPADWDFYKLRSWVDFEGHPRLVLTDYFEDKLVFWTARAIEYSVQPRYLSVPGGKKSFCVWNLSRINPNLPIYVAEGILSARACGTNGVAIYGKAISDVQVSRIANKAKAGVRIVIDPDAKKNIYETTERFIGLGVETGAVILPDGNDPDEMEPSQLAQILGDSKPMSEVDLIRLRMENTNEFMPVHEKLRNVSKGKKYHQSGMGFYSSRGANNGNWGYSR
jgi:hypothetical protein